MLTDAKRHEVESTSRVEPIELSEQAEECSRHALRLADLAGASFLGQKETHEKAHEHKAHWKKSPHKTSCNPPKGFPTLVRTFDVTSSKR